LRGGKHAIAAAGVSGGGPARLGACVINPGSDAERRLPSRFGGERLRAGDIVRIEKSGGGGVGAPRERPFAEIVGDVLDGYVTRDAAIADYGADPNRLDAAISDVVIA
jgi:N-methylhydantoinase B